jgi:membrane protease YdiL (CAAX protease family)
VQNTSTLTPSPRSPTIWPRNSFGVTITIAAVIGAVVIVIGALVAAVIFGVATGQVSSADVQHNPPRLPADFQLGSQFAVYLPLAVYLLAVVPPLSRLSLAALGVRVPTAREVGAGVAGAAAMWITINIVSWIVVSLTHLHDTEAAVELLQLIHTPAQQVQFVLIAIVLAPLVEELTFRVFLFNAFLRWTGLWIALLVSSALFGLAHAQTASQVITLGIPLAAGGVVLALVYDRTRCYWSSAISHALFNSVSVVAVLAFHVKA